MMNSSGHRKRLSAVEGDTTFQSRWLPQESSFSDLCVPLQEVYRTFTEPSSKHLTTTAAQQVSSPVTVAPASIAEHGSAKPGPSAISALYEICQRDGRISGAPSFIFTVHGTGFICECTVHMNAGAITQSSSQIYSSKQKAKENVCRVMLDYLDSVGKPGRH